MTGATNRVVRRQPLLWKMEAVPALREVLFRPKSLSAVFDIAFTVPLFDEFLRRAISEFEP
jgi:hypothetical protein